MSVIYEPPTGDKKKRNLAVGLLCLVAVAFSAFSIIRQMPRPAPAHAGFGGAQGGTPGGAGGGPQLPGTRGQISAVSAGSITLQSRDGSAKTFALSAATKITVDQKPVAATDLKSGQRARVVSADGKAADEVRVRTRPPGGRGGGQGGGQSGPQAPMADPSKS